MKKWKSGVSIIMAAAMVMSSFTLAVPVKADTQAVVNEAAANAPKLETKSNLIQNGDFSNGLNGWGKWPLDAAISVVSDAEGTYTKYDTAADNGINQTVEGLESGAWYKLSAQVYADKAEAVSIQQKKPNTDKEDRTMVKNTKVNEWENLELTFQMPADQTSKNISVWVEHGNDGVKANVKAKNVELAKIQDPSEPDKPEQPDQPDQPTVSSETFYIDAVNGDDSNAGTAEDQAWKTFKNTENLRLGPGGKILLKAGCTWNGEQLKVVEAAGSAEAPVIIGRYGEGANPIVNGQGNPWQTNVNAPKEDVATVHIYNSKYITIENLEVTNWETDAGDLKNEGAKIEQSKYLLTGILVENHDAGDLPGVTIRDSYVHDVNGFMAGGGKKGSGGIIALVTGNGVKSKFTDLKITGNEVDNVSHEAIYMESSWASRVLVGGSGSQEAGSGSWVGWPDVYVAHNYVHDVAGDGIVLINADGGVAEYNLIVRSASEDWDYSRNPAHAAIWMWDCNNVTMQYNEAAHTESYDDGMAFDFDYGNQNVMYQYNYSHDNKGGFWMSCPGPYYTVNAVARYNISVNDGLFDGARIIRIGEKGSIGNQFHNNTMYWDHDYKVNAVEQAVWGTPPSSGTDIYNNIFYGNSATFVNNEGINYNNNCIYGNIKDIYPVDEDVNVIIADPQFVDTKSYTDGTFANGKVTLGSADGFKLQSSSPCIDAGMDFMAPPKESLDAVKNELVPTQITIENRDYAGNAAPYVSESGTALVDIGAFEYQGESTAEKPDVDKTYLQALVEMAEAYDADLFVDNSYKDMEKVLKAARTVLGRPMASQEVIDSNAASLVQAIESLMKKSDIVENTPEKAENILAGFNSEKDNAGFEKGITGDWGKWQSEVSAVQGDAHSGEYSLKVDQEYTGYTAYSEIGKIPVKPNTAYICEAWIKYPQKNAADVEIETKHHQDYAGSDIKLGKAGPESGADENGWRKVRFEFTTQGYNYISMSINSNVKSVLLDDVNLYEKYVVSKTVLNTEKADEALAQTPAEEESVYTEESWKAYEDAVLAVKVEKVNALATQESLDKKADDLKAAFAALAKKAPAVEKTALQELYNAHKDDVQGNYTDKSWGEFQKALKAALETLNNDSADQEEVNAVKKALEDAIAGLEENPAVPVEKTALQELYNAHKDDVQGNYTDKSWGEFQKALKAALEALNNDSADQEEVNAVKKALEDAIAGLEENPVVPVEKKALQELYNAHKDDKQGNYTDESWKAFKEALASAAAVLGDKDANQEQVNKAAADLKKAISGLTEKEVPAEKADKSELKKLYDAHKDDKQGNYTDTTWKSFQNALKKAKTVLDNESAVQKDVDKAKEDLEKAIKNLKTKTTSGTTTKPGSTTKPTSPKTGDETPIALLAMLLVLSGGTAVVIRKRRNHAN